MPAKFIRYRSAVRNAVVAFVLPLPPPPPPPPPISPEGKEGTCLIINYLRPSHEKAIAITSRSRGQRRYRRGLRLLSFLPSSLRSFVRPSIRSSLPRPTQRFISYVHADEEQCENWGSVSPGCRTLHIRQTEHTPGHHAAACSIP